MIGERIQTLLELENKNVDELAKHCNVTIQAAYAWLRGAEPRSKKKALIAKFFNVSVQDLEYAPVLSLVPSVRKFATNVQLDYRTSAHAADMMIADETGDGKLKSPEFKLGMRDHIIFSLSGTLNNAPYKVGTCQADAYDAGVSNAKIILSKIQF